MTRAPQCYSFNPLPPRISGGLFYWPIHGQCILISFIYLFATLNWLRDILLTHSWPEQLSIQMIPSHCKTSGLLLAGLSWPQLATKCCRRPLMVISSTNLPCVCWPPLRSARPRFTGCCSTPHQRVLLPPIHAATLYELQVEH